MANKRIVLNTAATYIRTIFTAGLTLFSSRWVLNSLGFTDYGLFSLVGSIILFITFLNGVMACSAVRYFAYSIGQGDRFEVNRWFNSAIGIHLVLAFVLVAIGWPIGEYVICNILTVPGDRLTACLWIFRASLVSAFVSIFSVPFVAMFTAKQHITELAAWGTLQSILTFTLAWLLRHASGDRLLFYAGGMVVIIVFVQASQISRAISVFDECRIVYCQWFDLCRFKSIFSFAGWNLLGWSGALFRDQGSAILLNLFFGPSVNAAFGIATQVSAQTNQLSTAMVGAFSPEITACEGSGDRTRMLFLSQRASKFGTILVILLAIPLISEMDYVLKVWLHEPPPFTALFCRLILVTFLIDRLSIGYMLAVQACGKIAAYQATVGTSLIMTLPMAWIFLKMGLPPTSIGIAFIITMTITSLGRVQWGRYLFCMSIHSWFDKVVWPSVIVFLVATVVSVIPHWLLPSSFLRLIIVFVASITCSLCSAWFFVLELKDRQFIRQNTQRMLNKFRLWSQSTINQSDDISMENKMP